MKTIISDRFPRFAMTRTPGARYESNLRNAELASLRRLDPDHPDALAFGRITLLPAVDAILSAAPNAAARADLLVRLAVITRVMAGAAKDLHAGLEARRRALFHRRDGTTRRRAAYGARGGRCSTRSSALLRDLRARGLCHIDNSDSRPRGDARSARGRNNAI